MQKFKVNGQSVPKIEWKQTDRRTDRRTETIALPPTLMRINIDVRVIVSDCCVTVGYTMNVVYFGWVNSAVELQENIDIPQFTLLGTRLNDCSKNYTAG